MTILLPVSAVHGGAISTIVDIMGTLALLTIDPGRAGVSVEMNQSFIHAAKIGDRLLLTGRTLRYGRSLAFTEVTIQKDGADDGSLIMVATGRHTKMFTTAERKASAGAAGDVGQSPSSLSVYGGTPGGG